MKKTMSDPLPVALKKRGRPRKESSETASNIFCRNLESGTVRKRGRPPKYEWNDINAGFTGKRESNKNILADDRVCDYRHGINSYKSRRQYGAYEKPNTEKLDHSHEERNVFTQISEYELLHKQRREEMLSMLRELFSVDSISLGSSEKTTVRPRKYSKRPLPPMRPRSLRLQGLSPGQRPLRRRRRAQPPRCLCCLLPRSSQIHD